jgi:cation:H+ antiporter
VPELSTALVSSARGYPEVGLGTLLGSNLFNGLFIAGTTALIHPVELDVREVAIALAAAACLAVAVFPPRFGLLARWRGLLLVAGYAAYVAVLV